jgi:sugar lactone lactonase YvrE
VAVRKLVLTLTVALAAPALAAAPAAAVPDCPDQPQVRTLLSGQGLLESVAADARGRLFVSDLQHNRILRLDRPGGPVRVLVDGIDAPGGLVMDGAGRLIAGFGDSAAAGNADDGRAGLERIDPDTGERRLITRGLGMANGVARGPDGTLYATNDFAGDVDRIRGGRVEPDWAKVESANGVAVDTANRFLYVVQTFRGTGVFRVDLQDPAQVTTYASPPAAEGNPLLDGMVRDGADRLYVAANGAGEVWRVDTDRAICALARGLSGPSMVAFGGGRDFPTGNLYAVTFGGDVVELGDVTSDPPTQPALGGLQLRADDRRLPARRRVRVTFTVTRPTVDGRGPAAGAKVRFAGQRVSTDRDGQVTIAYRFTRPRLVEARASLKGLRGDRLLLRVAR